MIKSSHPKKKGLNLKNRTLDKTQKRNLFILVFMALVLFALFCLPNAAASRDLAMVQVFQTDEANPLPTVLRLITPADSLAQVAKNFIRYGYYPYGLLYFAISAIVVLPLQWLGLIQHTTLVMLVLRQMTSVLPMLAALLILVYLQDEFRTYRSFVLFAFLASIPAVVASNLWWHPDGLLILFMTLALFFISRDELRFRINYYISAVMIGLAAAIKITGFYFFLVVGVALMLGLLQKKLNIWGLIKHSLRYILVMGATYIAASPYLLFNSLRAAFIKAMVNQSSRIQEGYGLIYNRGIGAAWPTVHQYYGEIFFLVAVLFCLAYGMILGKKKLYGLFLALFLPLSFTVFFISHFKYQYWLPAVLPVFSCVALVLPPFQFEGKLQLFRKSLLFGMLAVITLQFGLFLRADINTYFSELHRAENNPSIQFYKEISASLTPIEDLPLNIYSDPRVYLPDTKNWSKVVTYDLLDYGYIEENHFDVLLLMQQRILDYTNPNAVGIDPEQFKQSRQFYINAGQGEITGYQQVFSNAFGRIFIRADLYKKYYPQK